MDLAEIAGLPNQIHAARLRVEELLADKREKERELREREVGYLCDPDSGLLQGKNAEERAARLYNLTRSARIAIEHVDRELGPAKAEWDFCQDQLRMSLALLAYWKEHENVCL